MKFTVKQSPNGRYWQVLNPRGKVCGEFPDRERAEDVARQASLLEHPSKEEMSP